MRDYRNLPDAVLERLKSNVDEITVSVLSGDRAEGRRHVSPAPEIREDLDAGDFVIEGYATVYDTWYDVAGGPDNGIGWREMFATGSTSKSIAERDDVRLLVNHEGVALARTKAGTLDLVSDSVGLRSTGRVDGNRPDVVTVLSALERGDMDEMSLAFRAIRQEWNDDYTERIVREAQIFDVSVVTYPANEATVAQIGSSVSTLVEANSSTGGDPITTSTIYVGPDGYGSSTVPEISLTPGTLRVTTTDRAQEPVAARTGLPVEVARAIADGLRQRR